MSAKVIAWADAIADLDELPEGASVDLQSYVATYRAKRAAGDKRAATAYARAVVNRARRDGVEVEAQAPSSSSGSAGRGPTKADLEAEIERRNKDREEAARIVPAGSTKADLQAALDADDAKNG